MDDRKARYRAWLERFGFSDRDWRRIKLLTEEVTPNYSPAALDDLDAPFRVGVTRLEDAGRMNGRRLGTYNGCALLYWPMNERERASWRKRRR